jgi:hypothetical protein
VAPGASEGMLSTASVVTTAGGAPVGPIIRDALVTLFVGVLLVVLVLGLLAAIRGGWA